MLGRSRSIRLLHVFFATQLALNLCGQEEMPERLLSDATRIYFRFDSVPKTRELWDKSALGRLWLDPVMQSFRQENEKRVASMSNTLERFYGITPQLLLEAAQSHLVIAGVETPTHDLSFVYFIHIPPQSAKTGEQFIADAVKAIEKRGGKKRSEKFAIPATLFDLPDAGEQVVFANREEYVMVSGDKDVATDICKRWNENPSLKMSDPVLKGTNASPAALFLDREGFARFFRNSKSKTEGEILWYVDPTRTAAMSDFKKAKKENSNENLIPFPLRHGFPGIRGVGGRISLAAPGFDIAGELVIDAPRPRTDVLRILDFRQGDLGIPASTPDNICSCAIAHWELASIIKHLGPVFDDITNAPAAYDNTLKDAREKLGVDLEKGFFALLGTKVTSISHFLPEKKMERSLTRIAIKDPERNEARVAEMIFNIFSADNAARRARVSGKKHDLWKIRFKVGDTSTAFANAGLMVADGHLWLASHSALIEDMLLNRMPGKLNESEDFKAHSKIWREHLDAKGFLHGFIRSSRDFEFTYQTIRDQGINGLEKADSVYALILSKTLGNEVDELKIDYGKLPEYSRIKQYFGLFGYVGTETDTGWRIQFGSAFP